MGASPSWSRWRRGGGGRGIRPPVHDSLLGNLIVRNDDRTAAFPGLCGTLGELSIEGMAITIALRRAFMERPAIASHDVHTGWPESVLARESVEVPKYLRPRTDTPKLTVGHGSCLGCICSVRGAAGYQMFCITPTPIHDPRQSTTYLHDFMILFKPGDIVKFRPIGNEEHGEIEAAVAAGRYEPRMRPVRFSRDTFRADPNASNAALVETLNAN